MVGRNTLFSHLFTVLILFFSFFRFLLTKYLPCCVGVFKFDEKLLIGFGGKYGVDSDKQDKSAYSYNEPEQEKQPNKTSRAVPGRTAASSLTARFEKLATSDV